jgi:hypothetical protein
MDGKRPQLPFTAWILWHVRDGGLKTTSSLLGW